MAIAYVNSGSGTGSTAATTMASSAFAVTAHNTIVVGISNYTDPVRTITGVADTAGNTYTVCGTTYNPTALWGMDMYCCTDAIANASNVVTVTYSAAAAWRVVHALQYSGMDKSSVYDSAAAGKLEGVATTTHTSNTLVTATATELVCAFYVCNDNPYALTGTSPYNLRIDLASGDSGSGDIFAATAGTYSVALTTATGNTYGIIARSFKAQHSVFVSWLGGF